MKILKYIIPLCLAPFVWLHADEYRFGEGYDISQTSLTLGGYFSSVYAVEENTRYFDLDDVAVMAYGEYDRFAYLAELEASDVYIRETGVRTDERTNATFHIERLYGDYFFGEDERLRIGKFNSDIGFWNQMPINVLRDTTSSPYLVKDFFPKLTTGLHYEARQQNAFLERFSATVQHNGDLDANYNNFSDIDRHYALACDIGDNDLLWRFGAGYFRYEVQHESLYALGSLKMIGNAWNFIGEAVLRNDPGDNRTYYDMYAQGVWHLWPKQDVIVRTEFGKSPLTRTRDTIGVVGYTYRPLNNVALKGEYEAHEEDGLNHWLFSISAMF